MLEKNSYPVVTIIPSLNPDDKLLKVVSKLFEIGFSDVIVIDDGSRAECQDIFAQLTGIPGCVVLHHDVNKGKGRALKTAFSYYLENYDLNNYFGVVTADADGQHLPEDILLTANNLISNNTPKTNLMALGTRDFNEEQVPFKSRYGNKITTVTFKLLYGKWINDTQTGLRAISNDFVETCLNIPGERFEYEINMLIYSVLNKVDIEEAIIQTVYFDDNRETHFHPIKDSIKIYKVMFASFLKFTCSGLLSTLVDQGLFAVLHKLIFAVINNMVSIPVSALIARICSSYLNYSLNRTVVFKSSTSSKKTIVYYYLLCAAQITASIALVTLLNFITKIDASILKLIVDTFLFFVSYRIQRKWVFKEEKEK